MLTDTNKKFLNLTLIAVLIITPLVFGIMGMPTEMGLMIVACALAITFANLDQFERFKGAGFEAEMRKVVQDAYATTESLKLLGKPLILSTLANLNYANRWGGIKEPEKHKFKEELSTAAKELGVRDDEVEYALHQFYIWHGIDRIQKIGNAMNKLNIGNNENRKNIEILYDRSVETLPNIEKIRAALKGIDPSETEPLESYIEDYKHYKENKRPRISDTETE